MMTREGAPRGAAQPQTWVTHGLHCAGRDPDAGGHGAVILTMSTVPAMEMNSFVIISTISRTCRGRGSEFPQRGPVSREPRGGRARWPEPHLPGVSAGVDTQEARVLVAVVVGGRVVHPVMPVGT